MDTREEAQPAAQKSSTPQRPSTQPSETHWSAVWHVSPSARPEMFSQWGSAQTFGVAAATAESIRTSNATSLPALGSTAYANGLLYTQCVGGTAGNLSSAAQAACANAGRALGASVSQSPLARR